MNLYWSGLLVLVAGAVWSNIVVSKMAKIMSVDWHVKSDKSAVQAIRLYRAQYRTGPLYRDLKISYGLCGIGAVMIAANVFLSR